MRVVTIPSFAKVNLLLRVLGKRQDGYHELYTVFQTISLQDTLTLRESGDLTLTCDDPRVPTDGANLILKAADALRRRHGVKIGAAVHLKKRIPAPGGLGGGSSNAAAALLALCELWRIDADDEIVNIAGWLGADVPFFLYGGTAEGTGRGDVVSQMEDVPEAEMLVVTPPVSVSTPTAFQALNAPTLTLDSTEGILSVCRKEAGSLDLRYSVLKNDFEPSVFAAHPEIERVKRRLLDLGAVNAALSGSGASVFAIFDNTETRQTAMKALDTESTWRKFAVSTISRAKYREALRCSVVSD